jgi:hypothetical protein
MVVIHLMVLVIHLTVMDMVTDTVMVTAIRADMDIIPTM